jgi:hypothetical protein
MAFHVMACGDAGQNLSDGGEQESSGSVQTEQESSADTVADAGYIFSYHGTVIRVDGEMTTVRALLGEPVSCYEDPSCAAQGIDRIYNYTDFDIYTYADGDVERIRMVVLRTDNVATPEGVDLSASRADVVEAYGEDYTEEKGQIVYEKNGVQLCFILDGEDILSIEYGSNILN